jgi:hypothetical protein
MKADDLPTITIQFFAEILVLPTRKRIEYREMKLCWETKLKAVMKRPFKYSTA